VVLAFYMGQGCAGEGLPEGGNGGVNVFNAIEDGEVKWRVKEGVLMAGLAGPKAKWPVRLVGPKARNE
jgi:hypothetical protein